MAERKKQLAQTQEVSSGLKIQKKNVVRMWEHRVRKELPAAQRESPPALIDSLPSFLDRLTEALENQAQGVEQALKPVAESAAEHGETRADIPPYTLDQVLLEYRILREVILDVLHRENLLPKDARDIVYQAIQEGMTSAATEFLRIRTIREKMAEAEAVAANQRLHYLQAVTEFALARTTSPHELLHGLLGQVQMIFRADTAAILQIKEDGSALVVSAAHGTKSEFREGEELPTNGSVAGEIFNAGSAIRIERIDPHLSTCEMLQKTKIVSLMGAPLRSRGQIIGVIHIGSVQPRTFTDHELTLLQMIADRIGIALDNSRLYQKSVDDYREIESERNLRKQFVSILSHDVRNPLTAARLNAELVIRNASQPGRAPLYGMKIASSISRADQLIKDLLDLNKILAGQKLPLKFEELDLKSLGVDVLRELILEHGDHWILQAREPLCGEWSPPEIRRLLELSMGMGLRFGQKVMPIGVTIEKAGKNAKIEVRFTAATAIPHEFIRSGNFSSLDPRQSDDWRKGALELTLIAGIVHGHEGTISLEVLDSKQVLLRIELPIRPAQPG